jgi:hypothetical protein
VASVVASLPLPLHCSRLLASVVVLARLAEL